MRVKDIITAKKKYQERTAVAVDDYKQGVQSVSNFEELAASESAESSYAQGVQQAVGRRARAAGIMARRGKWQKNAVEKGVNRYPEGTRVGASEYEARFRPFIDALRSVELPPRGPRRSPANLERVAKVREIMIATADQQKGIAG
jgi:hypothetical protein